MTNPERVADIIVDLNKKTPIICSFIGGTSVAHPKRYLKEHGVVEYETPERGIKALARLKEYYEHKAIKSIFEQKVKPNKETLKKLNGKTKLSMKESFDLLKEFDIKTPNTSFVTTIEEAEIATTNLKFPVALKTASGLAHKTDYGLVKANILTKEDLLKNVEVMLTKSKEINIEPILAIQEMVPGQEVLVSAITSEFGKVVTYGLGGIFVEVMKDFSQKIAPITENDIDAMLSEVKGSAVLRGARTKKKYDIDSLKKLIKSLSLMAQTYPQIKEIEFNPVMVSETGALAVDAVIAL
jgi:acetyltransferase